ncbi:hypothetical protein KY284_010622 [Solanum tuberosum]|nr:hypothetical protein KY284_010622 [Solanum tuberosum]
MSFFKVCWETLKEDLMQTIHNFHQKETFEKSFNATFVALIPKKHGAKELKDFRPISLIGGVYKIITKLLTERMKKVMGVLVDEHQMAFLKGRQIMDASLLANELVDSRVKQNLPGVLCKLDIEKAYDHVNWSFLLKILRDMGFENKWINWIKVCISTVKFSLIINGNPEGFFQSQRGLRQGDPMSPFLFILAMEGLNSMIRKASENGWLQGFSANANRGDAMEISHLLYADDSLVFCGAEVNHIRHLRAILTIFEGISGLHVNWHKSCLYPVNQVANMQVLAENLGCQVASLPTKYLGMPLGAKNKEVEVWNEVLERCEKKLSRWKSQYLSLGGRITLIKSVMDALPTYMMSLFPIPRSIEKKINKSRRVFLWQGNKEKLGYNLVKWDVVTLNKMQGGLGIKKLNMQNVSLLKKWLWRFCSEDMALWRRFISQKYGLQNNWITEEANGTFGCSVWKTIRRLWPSFIPNLSFRIGNGVKTSFWNELWLGEENLKIMYPDLYILSLQQMDTVAQVWSPQGWDLIFRRALNDWEVDRVAGLLHTLNAFPGVTESPDTPIWKMHKKGIVSVKSCYWSLNSNQAMEMEWPWKLIWKIKVPHKVSGFIWLAIREACLTHEVLQRRGIQICSRCFMCGEEAEVNSHLFLHCRTAANLWSMFLCILGINWVMPKTTLGLLRQWEGVGRRRRSKEDWWKCIPACIWWTLWKERNERSHDGKLNNTQKIKMNSLSLLYFWCKQDLVGEVDSLVDFKAQL